MRRLTRRYKRWLIQRARNEARKHHFRDKWLTALIATRSGQRLAKVLPEGRLPPVFCLDDAYEETIGFIHDLRIRQNRLPPLMALRGTRIGWVRNYHDFKTLQRI